MNLLSGMPAFLSAKTIMQHQTGNVMNGRQNSWPEQADSTQKYHAADSSGLNMAYTSLPDRESMRADLGKTATRRPPPTSGHTQCSAATGLKASQQPYMPHLSHATGAGITAGKLARPRAAISSLRKDPGTHMQHASNPLPGATGTSQNEPCIGRAKTTLGNPVYHGNVHLPPCNRPTKQTREANCTPATRAKRSTVEFAKTMGSQGCRTAAGSAAGRATAAEKRRLSSAGQYTPIAASGCSDPQAKGAGRAQRRKVTPAASAGPAVGPSPTNTSAAGSSRKPRKAGKATAAAKQMDNESAVDMFGGRLHH